MEEKLPTMGFFEFAGSVQRDHASTALAGLDTQVFDEVVDGQSVEFSDGGRSAPIGVRQVK